MKIQEKKNYQTPFVRVIVVKSQTLLAGTATEPGSSRVYNSDSNWDDEEE